MSTRSIVARAEGDGFSGRYVHDNGYPPYQGATLWRMAKEEFKGDIEAMLKALVDKGVAWSLLDDAQDWAAYEKRWHPYPETKKRWVKGLGVKMAQQDIEKKEWHGEEDADFSDAEWIYVLSGGEQPTLRVLTGKMPPELIGSFDLRGEEPDWQAVECGADLERCPHVAEAHFPETSGTPAASLSAKQYLGREPMEPEDAWGALYLGEEWKLTSMKRRTGSYPGNRGKLEVWAESASGQETWLQVEGEGTPAMDLHYPKTLAGDNEVAL